MMKYSTTLPLLMLPLLTSFGCWQSTPAPIPVPQGMRVELYEVAPPSEPNHITAVRPGTGVPILLKTPPLIVTSEVDTVQRQPPQANGASASADTALGINLTTAGAMKMQAATANANGQEIALVINGTIVAVAQVRAPIADRMVLTGGGEGDFEKQVEALTGGL